MHLDEDPYYRKLSELLRETIEAYHQQRLSEAEYLRRVSEIEANFINNQLTYSNNSVAYNANPVG